MRSWSELYLFISIRREIFIPWPQISPSVVSCWKLCRNDRTSQFTEPIGGRVGARGQQPKRKQDLEAVKLDTICLKKSPRSGHASAVTAKSNEIIGLISDDRNLQEVKEKLIHVDNALQRPRVAHHDYSSEILDEDGIAECQLYLESEERKLGLFH